MDVHDLARAQMVAWGITERLPAWVVIGRCYLNARALVWAMPLIESHTRDAVEAERAAWEAVALAFLETREMLGLVEPVICDECCPTTWVTAEGQPHCKLHEDVRAVLFKHEAVRDAIAARKAQP